MSRREDGAGVSQTFADQFERAGTSFIYRKSQKGEAIRVSADERCRFVDEFDRRVRRAKWIIYIGLMVVLGGIVLLSVVRGSDLSQPAIFAGFSIVMIPFVAYYWWAWAAPARELAGRTPVAGELSPEEVRRLRFQRLTYGQLATGAFGALVIPFVGMSRGSIFSGWNRLWLALGGVLLLLVAVQAFRKWRFEQEDSHLHLTGTSYGREITQSTDEVSLGIKEQLWRYRFVLGIFAALAFLFFTPAGGRVVHSRNFWPTVMIGVGAWSIFTVGRGFAKGYIEPFVRGVSNTYEREMQPVPFWMSMGWNGIFGCLCVWLAFQTHDQASAEAVRNHCYDEKNSFSPQQVVSACNQIVGRKVPLGSWTLADAFVARAIAYERLRDHAHSIADYSEALRLEPDNAYAYEDRGLANAVSDNPQNALADFSAAIRLKASPRLYVDRGFEYGHIGNMQSAIADFSEAIRLSPNNAQAYYYRAQVYRKLGDTQLATTDFEAAFRLDPSLCGGCRTDN